MRLILLFLIFIFCDLPSFSQDTIQTTGGAVVNCEVIGVTTRDVKYKKSGPEHRKVFSVLLENVVKVIKDGKMIYPEPENGERKKLFYMDASPSFFGFNVGPSIPFGAFGNNTGAGAGYASTGFSWHLEGAQFIKPFVALGFKAGSFSNNTDEMAWQSELNRFSPGVPIELSSGGWTNGYFMVGPYYSILSNRMIFDFDFMVGLVNTVDPQFEASFVESGSKVVRSSQQGTTSSFGLGFGGQVRIPVSHKIGIKISGDFINAEPRIVTNIIQTVDGNFDGTSTIAYEQSVSALNLSAGIVVLFPG